MSTGTINITGNVLGGTHATSYGVYNTSTGTHYRSPAARPPTATAVGAYNYAGGTVTVGCRRVAASRHVRRAERRGGTVIVTGNATGGQQRHGLRRVQYRHRLHRRARPRHRRHCTRNLQCGQWLRDGVWGDGTAHKFRDRRVRLPRTWRSGRANVVATKAASGIQAVIAAPADGQSNWPSPTASCNERQPLLRRLSVSCKRARPPLTMPCSTTMCPAWSCSMRNRPCSCASCPQPRDSISI